jgi:hypothetical protein
MARTRKNLTGTTITVTALDIKRGESGDPTLCPIARAASRTLRRRALIGDTLGVEYSRKNRDESVEYSLPKRAHKFIRKFDKDESVRPFTFRLGKLAK